MKLNHSVENWLSWMDELSRNDYVIIDQFLHQDVLSDVNDLFIKSLPLFSKAGIGALNEKKVLHDIRGDYTYWIDRKRDNSIDSFWSLVDETIYIFKRYCFLSLSGYEFHFANYPPGTKYEKHLDQFMKRNNRTITLVFYLNKDWKKGDGGELEIFLEGDRSIIIEPIMARCVMFKSDVIPHRVLESNKDRYSLTGWLLQHPAQLGQFLG